MGRHCITGPGHAIAAAARSSHSAVRRSRCAEFRAASTRRPVTLPGRWPRPKHSTDRAVIVNVSRCCLPISSGSFGSVVCGCVARAVPSSSSHWQQSRRTSAGLPSSLSAHRRSQRGLCVSSVELVAPPACYRADGEDSKSSVSCHSLMSADFCNKICQKQTSGLPLFDHLVGKLVELCGHLETQSFSGLQIDDKLEFGRLLHR